MKIPVTGSIPSFLAVCGGAALAALLIMPIAAQSGPMRTANIAQCARPTFSPAPGVYASPQSVTISTTTAGATIRYTTDGSTPSATVGTVYGSPVSISANTTLKAIAFKSGMAYSNVTSGNYAIMRR